MSTDNSNNNGDDERDYLELEDSRPGEDPEDKWGMKLTAPLFTGFIVAGAILMFLIMYCSVRQERRKRQKSAGMYSMIIYIVATARNHWLLACLPIVSQYYMQILPH
jgi:heme/copper-type cytochrome/quinol oxidase subunit 2